MVGSSQSVDRRLLTVSMSEETRRFHMSASFSLNGGSAAPSGRTASGLTIDAKG